MSKEQEKQLGELEQLELEAKRLEIEERKQSLESKKIQDELNRIQLGDRRQELETKINNKAQGRASAEKANEDREAKQAICNHHVGGEGGLAVHNGQGDLDRPTCIGGIQFLDESIMLFCQRCGDTWRSTDAPARWAAGIRLFQKTQNKQAPISVVGGVKQTQKASLLVQ